MKKTLSVLILSLALALSGCGTRSEGNEPHSGDDPTSVNPTTNKNFENVFFDSKTLIYDGESHILDEVRGAPEGTQITYTGRELYKDAGTYTASALLSKKGYNDKTLTATLTINKASFTNITFSDGTFEYDGSVHSIYVSGAPSFATVTYTNNGKTDSGTYTVTATIKATNYETMTKTATLTITPIELTKSGYFHNKAFIYDGQNHSIVVDSAPSGLTITYKCLNASGTNTFKDAGVYEVEATVKSDNNHLSKKYATLTITTPASASIDSTKTPLTINENLKWDQLHSALANGNFTMKGFTGSYDVENIDDDAPSNILDDTFEGHTSGYLFASDGKEAFQNSYSLNTSSPTNYYDYYKEQGNDIIHLDFDDDYDNASTVKFPKQAFKETIANSFASDAFVSLTKGENGEFLSGIDGDDYYSDVGTPYIENGVFTVLMEHPRTISSGYRYFYRIVKYYNIGNTIVDVPSNYVPSQDYINTKMGVDDFYLNGAKYGMVMYGTATNYNYYYTAQLYIDYHHAVFLKPGTYTVLPIIYNRVVKAIIYTKSYYAYNTSQSGYNYRLYVDSNGAYQGDYSEYGKLEKFTINEFITKGGTVEYYDEWNN